MNKRIFDIFFSATGLFLLSPLLVVIAFMIWVCDGFPVLFRQSRVGKNGREFILFKFRTMSLPAPGIEAAFDAGDTKRVTRLGSFLRKTKLDELPQLWNVLMGDMSFVGPRPEVRKWVDAYPDRWAQVHQVKPGITDPASIYFRNEEDLLAKSEDPKAFYYEHILPQKLDLYIQYVKTQSFRGDVFLIFKTILAVFLPGYFAGHPNQVSKDKLADSLLRKEP
jgi:lipopolysaccharide/colanic/teichoic acid biosynthesis glycosyltransferase